MVFIPLAYPNDIEESYKVAKLMKNEVHIIEEPLTSKEHLALIGNLEFLIGGVRLHSLVFAAQGVPLCRYIL